MLALPWQVTVAVDSLPRQSDTIASHGLVLPAMVKNPVPGFVGRVFQWAFNLPQWVQWGAIVLGVVVVAMFVVLVIVKRERAMQWLATRSRGYKIALAGASTVILLGAGGVGFAGNYYTMHNNDFCVGCHVMGTAWTAFQKSEHRKLQCHDCHQQSKLASMRQLYFWVAERPQEIPKHAKVPTAVCSECHVQSVADSNWKRIIATAGHRLHMKSDSSALKKVACVTCHGIEVHRFMPVDETCGQSGCHKKKDTQIVLGKMAGQTNQHCTGCHTFTRSVPENISMDSTRKFLIANGSPQSCLGCHDMKERMKDFDPALDVGHKAVCGSCHDPHKQTTPKQAFESCASGSCHKDLASKSPFHADKSAHRIAECGTCHKAHTWKPIGRECIDCHKGIFNSKPRSVPRVPPTESESNSTLSSAPAFRPIVWTRPNPAERMEPLNSIHRHRNARALPVRSTQARSVRRTRMAIAPARFMFVVRQVASPPPRTPPPKQSSAKNSAEFSHRIHIVLACAGCHDQKAAPGALRIRSTNDCAACHHSPERSVACIGCHSSSEQQSKVYSRPVTMHIATAAASQRTLPFAHRTHRDLDCKSCHTNGVKLAVTRDCQSCHTDHHDAERTCLTCHQTPKTAHVRAAHDGCAGSGCHTNTTVVALPTSRQVCLSCHAAQVEHKPKRECVDCHAVKWGPAVGAPH